MSSPLDQIDENLDEINRLLKFLKQGKGQQVRSSTEKDSAKAVGNSWMHNHRKAVATHVQNDAIKELDGLFAKLIEYSGKNVLRSKYLDSIKNIRKLLQGAKKTGYLSAIQEHGNHLDSSAPPSFDSITSDPAMHGILATRWSEIEKCVSNNAPLAASVMMGGLLESILMARMLQFTDGAPFKQPSSPKDQNGRAIPFQQWMLKHYLDVAHDLQLITRSGKDVGVTVMDYRNYIHPHKQLRHNIVIHDKDARLIWTVVQGIVRQITT